MQSPLPCKTARGAQRPAGKGSSLPGVPGKSLPTRTIEDLRKLVKQTLPRPSYPADSGGMHVATV
jgi:hypothetical protein